MTAAKVSSGVVGVGLREVEAVRTVHLGNGCLDNRTYRLGSIEIALILVTGDLDEATLFVICGIAGALASLFLEAKP